jgi:Icc-related predicted phosphoesterase
MTNFRIGYMSDLHLEFEERREFVGDEAWYALRDARRAEPGHPQIGPYLGDLKGKVDMMVIAGDTKPGTRGVDYHQDVAEYLNVPIITVAGNHEFYGHDMIALRPVLKAESHNAGVEFLDNDRATFNYNGTRVAVLGTTLWTDFALLEPDVSRHEVMARIRDQLSDYESIYYTSLRNIDPTDIAAMHDEAVRWLEREIVKAKQDADRVLVVSHHCPISEGRPTGQRARIAYGYCSALEDLIKRTRPDGWIFGHVHEEYRFMVDGIPVVSACRGYVRRGIGWEFRPSVLEI